MKSTTPLKRSKSLVSLSKDHHDGLLLAWKTRQGIRYNVGNERILKYIAAVFDKELQPHFLDEEHLLFSKLSSTDELRIKAEEQHATLRTNVAAFKSSAQPETAKLSEFATLLEEHIRFEERILFPHLEKVIPSEELEKIGAKLEAHHNEKKCVVWQDEFWLKK